MHVLMSAWRLNGLAYRIPMDPPAVAHPLSSLQHHKYSKLDGWSAAASSPAADQLPIVKTPTTPLACSAQPPPTILSAELYKVCLQHAHQDSCQEPSEQQHCDTAVDDAEPVDLQVDGVQREALVPLQTLIVRDGGGAPLHTVREGHLQARKTAKNNRPIDAHRDSP